MSNESELTELIGQLTARVAQLEVEVARLKESADTVPADTLMAISAAVAAYTGYKGKVRAVRFRSHSNYTRESRSRVHDRQVR